MTKRIRDYKVRMDTEHSYRTSAGRQSLCLDCGGNYDMLGHVLARRRKADKPLADPRRKS